MNKRETHEAKLPVSREAYSRYLKNVDCEPTVNDKIRLEPSTEGGEELRESTSKRRRKVSTGQKLQEHMQEHWVSWLFGAIVAITAWLMLGARIDLARIEASEISQKESISDIKTGVQKSGDKNQEQDLTLREHSLRILNVEEKVSAKKK